MKSHTKYVCSMAAGMVMGAAIYFVTKGKQEKARKENRHVPYGAYEVVIKWPLDVAVSGMALVVLSPVMGIITLITAIKMKGNPFFMQRRPGKDEKIFQLIKFRSMTDERDQDGNLLPDAVRLTNYGKFLKTSSLDGRVIIGETTESLKIKGFARLVQYISTGVMTYFLLSRITRISRAFYAEVLENKRFQALSWCLNSGFPKKGKLLSENGANRIILMKPARLSGRCQKPEGELSALVVCLILLLNFGQAVFAGGVPRRRF